jgi:hypothetical protein
MGALGTSITDLLTSLPAAITGAGTQVVGLQTSLEAKGAELETAIKVQLALQAAIAVGTAILVIQSLKGR